MQSLEAASEEGECEFKKAKPSYTCLPFPTCSQDSAADAGPSCCDDADDRPEDDQPPAFDIFKRLQELSESSPDLNLDAEGQLIPGVAYKSLILEELVQRERLNTLILNLYAGNKGYSFAFRSLSRTDPKYTPEDDTANTIEMREWLYEQSDLLGYIADEELPPFLVDVLAREFPFLFYSGCVVCEVRDYHRSNPRYQVQHILLRPTQKSILADANNLIDERPELTADDRDAVEGQILLATTSAMCLEPDPTIEDRVAEAHNESRAWTTRPFRRMAKKFSQVTVNRKRKLDRFTYRPGMELYEFACQARAAAAQSKADPTSRLSAARRRSTPSAVADAAPRPPPVPCPEPPALTPPRDPVVIRELKTYQRPAETSDCLPQLIEEYVFETDVPSKGGGGGGGDAKPRVYHIKLSIFQRPANCEYLGELYLDRDHRRNEQNGVACRFSLGSRANAHRYIHQFTEIFTESGRKSVRIRHDINPDLKWRVVGLQQGQAQTSASGQSAAAGMAKEHLSQLNQQYQKQQQGGGGGGGALIVNGTVGSVAAAAAAAQKQAGGQQGVPILQSHLQNNSQKVQQMSSQEMEINALATEFMNSAQQFQASANAKQQQHQQHKYLSGEGGNAAIINLLNKSSPAAAAADSPMPAPQQRLLARKMTLAGLGGARVLAQQPQAQTITLASVNSGGGYVSYQPQAGQRLFGGGGESKSLSALLVGTPAADRPDIVGPNTGSLLLEKLAGAQAAAQQFVVQQAAKGGGGATAIVSPIGSPPLQNSGGGGGAVNVQGLNFAQLQSLPNVQVQVAGFSQPISLSLNVSSGNVHGHPAGLLVSLPASGGSTQTAAAMSQAGGAGGGGGSEPLEGQTVVLTGAGTSNFAHLVGSTAKGTQPQAQQARPASAGGVPQAVSIAPDGHQFQIISQLQRPGRQQLAAAAAAGQTQLAGLTARTLQPGTPITFKVMNPGQLAERPFNFDN